MIGEGTGLRAQLEVFGNPLWHPLDLRLVACVTALAAEETVSPWGLCDALGLEVAPLEAFLQDAFGPFAAELLSHAGMEPQPTEEELRLRHLLTRSGRTRSPFEATLACILARRCRQTHHLWQDLGLESRAEIGAVMERHFPSLVRRNASGMRWKKFLYRMICADHDHAYCSAPTCEECEEHGDCFGSESGASLLAGGLPA
ncbi:MAG: hypothetical protein RL318_1115 [Fibrobacterota bacterium]